MNGDIENRNQLSPGFHWISNRQWEAIVASLPGKTQARARADENRTRPFIESVLWIAANDAFWCDLPRERGAWRKVYVRFIRWTTEGVWNYVVDGLGHDTSMARCLKYRVEIRERHMKRIHLRGAIGKSDDDLMNPVTWLS